VTEPTDPDDGLDAARTDQLLDLADHLGLDKEAAELRAARRQVRCVERITRICELAGLPFSTDGNPGVVLRPAQEADPAASAYFAGAVAVSWQVSQELDDVGTEAKAGEEPAELWSVLHHAMELMLATLLQQGGCSTVLDSLAGDLIVRGVSDPEGLDPLYLTPTPGPSTE
jgi:hypothetical protein